MMELPSDAVRSKLRKQHLPIDGSDINAFCNQAWEELHQKVTKGERILYAEPYLVTIAYHAADELLADWWHPTASSASRNELSVDLI